MGVEVNLVTGKRGTPHISGSDLRAFNHGIAGMDGAIQEGRMFEATPAAGNKIYIADGDMLMQGIHWRIDEDTTKEIVISNGESNMKRCDLIIAHYHRDEETGVESVELEVLEGNPTSGTPAPKTYQEGNLRAGDSDARMAIYEVILDGFNVNEVIPLFDWIPRLVDIHSGARAYVGSKVLRDTSKTTARKILSYDEVRKIIGETVSDTKVQTNTFVSFMNGHYEANKTLVVIASEVRNDSKGFYARFSESTGGDMRVNYLVVYGG